MKTRLTKIDDLTRGDHWYLSEDDSCYFLGEYTARKGYSFSKTNDLILNLKKGVDRKGKPEWAYKRRAINNAGRALATALRPNLHDFTFVPIPPSKAKDNPLYDDRLMQVLHAMAGDESVDIRELVLQTESLEAAHDSDDRPNPEDLEAVYDIDESLCSPVPKRIAIIDDVLTTGAHFVAMKSKLLARFPDSKVVGVFIARRAPHSDFSAMFENND